MLCKGYNKDGSACQKEATPGAEFCHWHDPERGKRVRVAKPRDLDNFVVEELQYVIGMLGKLEETPEVARALTTALNTLDKALDRRQQNLKFKGDIKIVIKQGDDTLEIRLRELDNLAGRIGVCAQCRQLISNYRG